MEKRANLAWTLTVVLVVVLGCGQGDRVELTRTVETASTSTVSPVKTQLGARSIASSPAASGSRGPLGDGGPPTFTWSTPPTWKEVPATEFRNPNFVAGDVECYVSAMPASGGGMLQNVNRWRSQMGLPPFSATELDGLPTVSALNSRALAVELDGSFRGMGTDEGKPGYRLKGILLEKDGYGIFIKMVGPVDRVEEESASFDSFLASLNSVLDSSPPRVEGTSIQLAVNALPAGHPPVTSSTPAPISSKEVSAGRGLPPGHPPVSSEGPFSTMSLQPGQPRSRGQGLTWNVPDGWQQGPARPMRLVTYTTAESSSSECYVTLINDDAGGAAVHINHWRSQYGQTELSDQEIAALPTISVFGIPTPVVAASDGERAFVGVAWTSPTGSFFARLIGPPAEVEANRERFESFCQSFVPEQ